MISKELFWHIVSYSLYTYENYSDLNSFINNGELEKICKSLKEKTIIVLGGDWAILKSVKENYKLDLPFLWINFWNKWFLLNDKSFITPNSKYEKVSYDIMNCSVIDWENIFNDIFINEVNITSGAGQMLYLDISLKWKQKISIQWDWVLISTPAWSTWYNASLGWPMLPHNMDALILTFKAPWKPKWQAPIVLNDDEDLLIENSGRFSEMEIYVDSRLLYKTSNKADIKIKKSDIKLTLLIDKNYKKIWDNKVFSEQGFE